MGCQLECNKNRVYWYERKESGITEADKSTLENLGSGDCEKSDAITTYRYSLDDKQVFIRGCFENLPDQSFIGSDESGIKTMQQANDHISNELEKWQEVEE